MHVTALTVRTQVRDKSAVLSLLQEELADVQRENGVKDEALRKLTAKLKEEQQTHMLQVRVVACRVAALSRPVR